uniref:C2H2-type domain-containing protein n=1 Tax=Sinocyclocheilus anshuiensis TaxID=1608454 RepID=A0A671K889_9TELE
MRDPEPCRMKHTQEQTVLIKEKEENGELNEEEEKHYIKAVEKPLSCSQTNQKELKKRRDRVKSFTCTQCGKSLTSNKSFKVHMNIHTGEKPFTCDQCGNSFTKSSNLKEHMNIHTREKLHECDQCGKTFLRASNLKNHLKVHTKEKP